MKDGTTGSRSCSRTSASTKTYTRGTKARRFRKSPLWQKVSRIAQTKTLSTELNSSRCVRLAEVLTVCSAMFLSSSNDMQITNAKTKAVCTSLFHFLPNKRVVLIINNFNTVLFFSHGALSVGQVGDDARRSLAADAGRQHADGSAARGC